MQSAAKTVKEYLKHLPDDRRAAIAAVRDVILKNLPKGYEEGMQYGMIGYYIPHSLYPDGYHVDPKVPLGYAALASQKNHMALYLMNIYVDPKTLAWFQSEYKKNGKKMDMGKSCVRFTKLDNLPLDLIGQAIARTQPADVIACDQAARRRKPVKRSEISKKSAK